MLDELLILAQTGPDIQKTVAKIMALNANLGYVLTGGLLGGLLQPAVASLNPKTPDPITKSWMLSPLLGIAAAGITVYVVAKTDTTNVTHLLFFSLLCGLAFPAILTSAVDQMSRKTEQAKKESGEIASTSKAVVPETAPQIADDIKAALVNNPAKSLTVSGQAQVEQSLAEAVRNIAQSAPQNPSQTTEIVKKLEEVATVAETAGYTGAATVASEQAAELIKSVEAPAEDSEVDPKRNAAKKAQD